MAMGNITGRMAQFIRGISLKVSVKEKGCGQALKEIITRANSRMTKRMASEPSAGRTETNIKVNSLTIRGKVKAKWFGVMEALIKAIGKTEIRTDSVICRRFRNV